MNALRKTQFSVVKGVIIFSILIVVVSFLFLDEPKPFAIGVVFGALISILNFVELANTLNQAVQMTPSKAQAFTAAKYMVRMVISGVVLYISIVAPYINVLGTIVGLIAIKPIILATNLFNDKAYFKNIFIRKEDESNGQ